MIMMVYLLLAANIFNRSAAQRIWIRWLCSVRQRCAGILHSKHHVAKDYEEGIQKALEAGLDVRTNFTQPKEYLTALMDALKSGKIKEEVLNERVRSVLKTKFRLGLFDEPIRNFIKEADRKVHTKEDEALSVDVNRRSVVLLKNEKQTLPLDTGKLKIS